MDLGVEVSIGYFSKGISRDCYKNVALILKKIVAIWEGMIVVIFKGTKRKEV